MALGANSDFQSGKTGSIPVGTATPDKHPARHFPSAFPTMITDRLMTRASACGVLSRSRRHHLAIGSLLTFIKRPALQPHHNTSPDLTHDMAGECLAPGVHWGAQPAAESGWASWPPLHFQDAHCLAGCAVAASNCVRPGAAAKRCLRTFVPAVVIVSRPARRT